MEIFKFESIHTSAHKNKEQPPNVTQSQHNDEILPRKGSLPPDFIPDFNDEEETLPHTANQATTNSIKDMETSYSNGHVIVLRGVKFNYQQYI